MENTEINTIIDNMIAWAKDRMGDTGYAGWCLSFIEDALEISNDIEIFGGDSAKESSEMYSDALRAGEPERGAFVFYDCLCPGKDGLINWGHCGISRGRADHSRMGCGQNRRVYGDRAFDGIDG